MEEEEEEESPPERDNQQAFILTAQTQPPQNSVYNQRGKKKHVHQDSRGRSSDVDELGCKYTQTLKMWT